MDVQSRKFQVKQQLAQDEAWNPTPNLQDLLHLEEHFLAEIVMARMMMMMKDGFNFI